MCLFLLLQGSMKSGLVLALLKLQLLEIPSFTCNKAISG
jgi:hypothetical protein